jgi:hypothetical protein
MPVPVILRKQPFFERPTQLAVRGEFLNVKAYQIILWASVANRKSAILESNTPRFPVLLDTGLRVSCN